MAPSEYIRQRDPQAENGHHRDLRYPDLPDPLTVPVYDNHTHLEIADGDHAIDYVEHLRRAKAVGVAGVVQASGDVETSRWAAEVAAVTPGMLAAVAIHPNEAPHYAESGTLTEALYAI